MASWLLPLAVLVVPAAPVVRAPPWEAMEEQAALAELAAMAQRLPSRTLKGA
jgi:hypothetical protein